MAKLISSIVAIVLATATSQPQPRAKAPVRKSVRRRDPRQ
jgi:hypothetical protein